MKEIKAVNANEEPLNEEAVLTENPEVQEPQQGGIFNGLFR
jgi:hypothetical protein